MPSTKGADWGFIGPAYEAPALGQDTQKCVNYYVELADSAVNIPGAIQQPKMPVALLGAPGTVDLLSLNANAQVRGAWLLPGSATALVVCGNTCYSVIYQNGALVATTLGTLLTAVGPVQIRDNGFLALIVDGIYGYTVILSTGAFAQITDPGFTGSSTRIAMIDGWFILNQTMPAGRNFYLSPLYLGIGGVANVGQIGPNGTGNWDPTQFALADATGDNLLSLIEDQRQLWLIKERSTEVWYDAGAAQFTFQRLQGVLLQIGIAAPQSVSRVDKGLMWLAANERGQNFVIRTQGFNYERVSTHAIDAAIASYGTVADALGWTYQDQGHEFYVLTFPTADVTWVYDLATGLWHERLSFNQTLGTYHRHRGNCVLNFGNQRIVGTWDTGALALMSRSILTDGSHPLVAWRRTGHIWDQSSRRRLFHTQLQIDVGPGVGLQRSAVVTQFAPAYPTAPAGAATGGSTTTYTNYIVVAQTGDVDGVVGNAIYGSMVSLGVDGSGNPAIRVVGNGFGNSSLPAYTVPTLTFNPVTLAQGASTSKAAKEGWFPPNPTLAGGGPFRLGGPNGFRGRWYSPTGGVIFAWNGSYQFYASDTSGNQIGPELCATLIPGGQYLSTVAICADGVHVLYFWKSTGSVGAGGGPPDSWGIALWTGSTWTSVSTGTVPSGIQGLFQQTQAGFGPMMEQYTPGQGCLMIESDLEHVWGVFQQTQLNLFTIAAGSITLTYSFPNIPGFVYDNTGDPVSSIYADNGIAVIMTQSGNGGSNYTSKFGLTVLARPGGQLGTPPTYDSLPGASPLYPFQVVQTGPTGSVPQLMLRYSDDGGHTFQYEAQVPIGMVGQYKNRAIKYNLGYSRDRVYDVRITDPIPRDIVGATLMLEQEQ